MSKKAFKSAIGGLYRLKLLNIEEAGIRIIKRDY
jgi:predicted RNA-binding protein (virulence factor B family)